MGFIFVTVLLYFGLGRPDLLQPQLHQKKLELAYLRDYNNTIDTDENAQLLLLYAKLKETLAKRPRDISGYSLLVKICLTLNKYPEARLAQEKVLFLKKSASNINDYALLLDTYLIAAEGRFSIEASKILKKVKIKYPLNENTHFFLILEHLERKEYKAAIEAYKNLKRENLLGTEKLILLESKLKKFKASNGKKMIISDSVFSMDGDIAPLDSIVKLSKKYECISMIDEAHATGILGDTGSGASEMFGVQDKIDICMGTLSKAVGSVGGYIAGSSDLIDYLKNRARSFIFDTSLPCLLYTSPSPRDRG